MVIVVLLVLAVVVGIVALVASAARRQRERDGFPIGIYGWLAWVGFGLVLTPLYLLRALADYIGALNSISESHPVYTFVLVATILLGALIIWSLILAYKFFRHRRSVPKMYIAFNVCLVLFSAGTLIGIGILVGASESVNQGLVQLFGGGFVTFLWCLYMLRSERVKNTFVTSRRSKNEHLQEVFE